MTFFASVVGWVVITGWLLLGITLSWFVVKAAIKAKRAGPLALIPVVICFGPLLSIFLVLAAAGSSVKKESERDTNKET